MLQLLVVALKTCLFNGQLIALATSLNCFFDAASLEIALTKESKCDFEVGLHEFVKIFGCQGVQGLPLDIDYAWILHSQAVVTHGHVEGKLLVDAHRHRCFFILADCVELFDAGEIGLLEHLLDCLA